MKARGTADYFSNIQLNESDPPEGLIPILHEVKLTYIFNFTFY